MRLLILLPLLLICCYLPAQNHKPQIDSLLNAYVQLNKMNGTILIYSKGEIIYDRSFGYANKLKAEFITGNSIFPIGSLTKSFTATLTLKLAEKQIFSLDDKVNKFIPDYPRGGEIAIRHLLTHTSGIYEEFQNPDYFQQLYTNRKFSHDEKMLFYKHQPLDFMENPRKLTPCYRLKLTPTCQSNVTPCGHCKLTP